MRSLASETARQTEACGQPSLAWFAADYQEELSAFDGLLLVSSACELARDCCPAALLICVKKNRNKAQPVLPTAFPADRMCLQMCSNNCNHNIGNSQHLYYSLSSMSCLCSCTLLSVCQPKSLILQSWYHLKSVRAHLPDIYIPS